MVSDLAGIDLDKPNYGSEETMIVERKDISSPVLRRIIEEVRNEKYGKPTAYNRIHNRHNRGR